MAATRSGPVATVMASTIPEDTSAEGSNDDLQPAQSLLQDFTGISSSLQTSKAPEHVQTSATLLTLGVDDKLRAKFMLGNILSFRRYYPLTPTRQTKLVIPRLTRINS